jgi:hypothetical protein
MGWLSGNSRQGFQAAGSTLQLGFEAAKYLNRVGDTTTVDRYPCLESLKAQQQNSTSKGTSFWHGVSNLFHLHSWNYVKTSVTDNETYTIAGVLAPGASGAAQAAKAAAQGRPTPSAPPTLRPVPGPDPVPPQLPPGEIPEIEPGASLGQRIGVAILNLVKGFGQNVEAMPVVCFTCGDSDAERKARGLPPLD